jgi:hypothetical protein
MGFLRRLLGGGKAPDALNQAPDASNEAPDTLARPAEPDAALDADEAERQHEREVMRAEAERLDPLRQRQLRYADHAWTPPTQGGERRSDDEAGTEGG